MRSIFILSSIFFTLTSYAQVSDVELIRENFRKQEDCWNKFDLECYCEAYTDLDSVRMIHQGGVIYGKTKILNFYKTYWNEDNMGEIHFDKLKIEKLSSEFYLVTGAYNINRGDQTLVGRFSVLMKNTDTSWKIYSDHSS